MICIIPKYKFTDIKRVCEGRTLTCIEAQRDFGKVKKGELGGFIEDTRNLSFHGDCWVGGGACVYGQARVLEDALVDKYAKVGGRAIITNKAHVTDNSCVKGHAFIGGRAGVHVETFLNGTVTVTGRARLWCRRLYSTQGGLVPHASDLVRIFDEAFLEGLVTLRDNVIVCGRAKVLDRARLCDDARIGDEGVLQGGAVLSGRGVVYQNGVVGDRSLVTNNAVVGGWAVIGGRSLITGAACVLGHAEVRDRVFSGDNYVTGKNGRLHIRHSCPPDSFHAFMRKYHADAETLPAACH